MICVSFGDIAYSSLTKQLDKVAMGEIRIDLLHLTDDQINHIFQLNSNLIATCRPTAISNEEQQRLLKLAIDAGAAFVDIEQEASSGQKQEIIGYAKGKGCKVIVSYHNYETTPDFVSMCLLIDKMMSDGADIAKVATTANSAAEASRILALYEHYSPNLVAIAMGEQGKITRIAAPLLGSPFTFAALKGKSTAPGQLSTTEMTSIYKIISNND